MILAAGAGRRMQPLTHFRAKPALPVLGIPLVAHSARLLHAAGIREIVVNLHHQGQTVRTALEQRQRDPRHLALSQIAFSYSTEDALQGTAGGIGRVREWLAAEGTAIVVNSDFIAFSGQPAYACDGPRRAPPKRRPRDSGRHRAFRALPR